MPQPISDLSQLSPQGPAVVTVGSFDGVHIGHQALIRDLVAFAHRAGLRPVVLTFYPHPSVVLRGRKPPFYLSSPEEKESLLLDLGVDQVVTHAFDVEVSHIRAADFAGRLQQHLGMRALWAGPDFALGYKREGTVEFLRALGLTSGFEVHVFDRVVDLGDRPVSSSRIREALSEGRMEEATGCLGRYYRIGGVVVPGDQRGRMIGIPTANLEIWPERLVPARGVYATYAWLDGQVVPAATNIGIRPTFDNSVRQTIEAHLLDYDGDLYGREVELDFVRRLRPEQKFSGIDALVTQVRADIEQARALLRPSA